MSNNKQKGFVGGSGNQYDCRAITCVLKEGIVKSGWLACGAVTNLTVGCWRWVDYSKLGIIVNTHEGAMS